MRKALELDPLGADTRELLDKLTHEISQQHALGNRGNGARVGAGSNGRPQAQAQTLPAQLSNHGPIQPQGRYVPFETDASARTFQLPEQQFQQQVRTYLSSGQGWLRLRKVPLSTARYAAARSIWPTVAAAAAAAPGTAATVSATGWFRDQAAAFRYNIALIHLGRPVGRWAGQVWFRLG